MVEGVIDTQGGGSSLAMMLARTFEEILEMVGVLLFIRAFLDIVVARHGTAENLDAA
jgi:hypothetical protein